MKFSFLIPSKNRLELLSQAVDSIVRQGYEDFEIVITDNASEQDYAGYIERIGDERIIYSRSPTSISVTQNWNNALNLASGDYILMLGDDDALTPGFIHQVLRLIEDIKFPDILFFAAYHYCYPGVILTSPKGYLADVRNSEFFEGQDAPFRLLPEQAHRAAKAVFDMRYLFGFNSQHFLFRAGFLKDIASSSIGSIFQSPYPDTFAAAVSFLKAKTIVVVPYPLVMIGISPKSFGYYYFNNLRTEGSDFLDNELVSADIRKSLSNAVLPGNSNNTNWLIAAEAARQALAPDFELPINIARYRTLQIVVFLRDIFVTKVRKLDELDQLASKLSQTESIFLTLLLSTIDSINTSPKHIINMFDAWDKTLEQFCPAKISMLDIGQHKSIIDAFNWLAKHPAPIKPPRMFSIYNLRRIVTAIERRIGMHR
jgi:glycosyltransferase involved in cell wall biosynthesis